MSDEIPTGEPIILDPLKERFEPLIWAQANELSSIKTPLAELHQGLYEQISSMHNRTLGISERDQLNQLEIEYWRVDAKLSDIQTQEDKALEALEALEQGTATSESLTSLFPQPEEETPETSKKKKRIREEKERLGFDPREIDYDLYHGFGSTPTTHLTTGHHQRKIKGIYDPFSAAGEFYDSTADTHGGKVGYGKNGNRYTTAQGKVVRKK